VTERLLVEAVRADELVKGDEAIIVEFRGVVESTREGPSTSGHPHKTTTWIALEGAEGAELAPDSQVLRVVPAEAEPTDATESVRRSSENEGSKGARSA
jgi:hypothetical protein